MSERVPADREPAPGSIERLVGQAPEAAPSREARERARAAFLTGDPSGARAAPAPAPLPAQAGRARWMPLALAAAAALAAVGWFGSRPVEPWRFVGEHEMRLGDTLLLSVAPGSEVSLPDPPGRWFGRTCELRVTTGSVFASTGGRPLGFDLVVTTPDACTRIKGTTFAVRRNDRGTCVCLYEGSVEVAQVIRGDVVRVPAGRRLQVYSDGQAPAIEPLDEVESRMLAGLHDAI